MYDRKQDGKELTLVVSGMLWNRSLVMKDEQTESLWSHLLGKCMRGEMEGQQLTSIPSLLTDWETWSRLHPDSTVMMMRRTAEGFTRDMYSGLQRFVAGMATEDKSKAWSFEHLAEHPLINDEFDQRAIVVAFQRRSATPFVYERVVNDQQLTFVELEGKTIDVETRSSWDMEFGLATEGKLKGTKLKPRVVISSFANAWKKFHPECEYWKPD